MFKRLFSSKYLILFILLVATFVRLYKINVVPPSLFGDELDLGYHAYSVLKTGKDYSGNFLPLHFHSLAEWRTPLYLYAAVPTVGVFGITPLGVRLPAVIFGILGIYGFYLLINLLTKNKSLALLSATLLTINPWDLQYSRAGFEVTMLLCFLLFGLYFFFLSFKKGGLLWLASTLLMLTPLIYSTAKMFTPFLMLLLFFVYRKEIFKIDKKNLIRAFVASAIFGGITAYAVLFSGGSQRFNYISVFSDPTIETEVGVGRLTDARVRGLTGTGLTPSYVDRLFHNKFTFWVEKIINNYLTSFSSDFLFVSGDPNPRHMIDGMGMFYKIEALALIAGILFFVFSKDIDFRTKRVLTFWLIFGVLPSSITRDGGNHATRLIVILPVLMFLISFGWYEMIKRIPKNLKLSSVSLMAGFYLLSFVFYLHSYYVHNPIQSERWWHAGWKEAITTIKEIDKNYDRVFITMADEPAWIFFAAYYQYDPVKWHQGFPMKGTDVAGFGGVSYIDKYYFGAVNEDGASLYDLSKFITSKDLYLASAKEIPWNLAVDPGRIPQGLKLIKAISYKSGDPAFYIFTKQ